jgi:hypothetical protein
MGLDGSKRYVSDTPLDPGSTWALNMDIAGTGRTLSFVRGVASCRFGAQTGD